MSKGISREMLNAAERLHSAALRLLRVVRVADRASGVAPAQLSALSVLVFGGDMPLNKLAEAEQVSAPTMSRIVSALERKGLVHRVRDREDRRIWSLQSTAKGKTLLLKGRDRRVEMLVARIATTPDMDVKSVAQAAEILERILYGRKRK